MSPPARYNRLAEEKSPYLLQHATNPVMWHPWGDEAFELARKQDMPIFLSIGYSTCHWCHVMAHESFEDEDVAKLLNEGFVCIKVDREERPDIDQQYMAAAQLMARQGGWPLTLVMTPDKKPFFAATYLPKASGRGMKGLMEILPALCSMWASDRDVLFSAAEKVTNSLTMLMTSSSAGDLPRDAIVQAYDELTLNFDKEKGGFGSRPKFPSPHNIIFLLRRWRRTKDPNALFMAEMTLNAMREGGIFDHVGGGFHRYSTDRAWKVPHFEKMLYDQALLAIAYTEAFQASGNMSFAATAEETLDYVKGTLMSSEGGFFSAEDADVEGEEGAYYTWSYDELERIFDKGDMAILGRAYSVKKEGNFFDEASGARSGKNILHVSEPAHVSAESLGMTEEAFAQRLCSIRSRLLAARSSRRRPFMDDKVITDWNGLAIAAMAKAGSVFDRSDYIEAAADAAEFILLRLHDPSGMLFHRYRDGEAAIAATIDDYAFLSWGLLELYMATWEGKYLSKAIGLVDYALDHFWDSNSGGFFLTADVAESLLSRQKEIYDGAMPSGNSVMLYVLSILSAASDSPRYTEHAHGLVRAFSADVMRVALGHTFFFTASDMVLGETAQVIVVGEHGSPDTVSMKYRLLSAYLPHVVHMFKDIEDPSHLERIAPFTKGMGMIEGKATAYVCRGHACQSPTNNPDTALGVVEELYSNGHEA